MGQLLVRYHRHEAEIRVGCRGKPVLASTLFPENGASDSPRRVLEEKVIFTKERLKVIASRSVHSHTISSRFPDVEDRADTEKKVEKRNMPATKYFEKTQRPTRRPYPSSLNSTPFYSTSSHSGATIRRRKPVRFRIGRVSLGY